MNESSEKKTFAEFREVSRVFKTKSNRVAALTEIDLTIAKGEKVALLGRSGSGKSTLLNLLGGLDRPTSGEIVVGGKKISEFDSDQMAEYRRTTVAMIFQAFHLIQAKTAIQNVELPFVFSGADRLLRREKAEKALAAVGLSDRATHRPAELSGGEQQRVAVARALVNKPSLLLADEPTGNLDSTTAHQIMTLLSQYGADQQIAILLVTHDEELASVFADRTLRLSDGRFVE